MMDGAVTDVELQSLPDTTPEITDITPVQSTGTIYDQHQKSQRQTNVLINRVNEPTMQNNNCNRPDELANNVSAERDLTNNNSVQTNISGTQHRRRDPKMGRSNLGQQELDSFVLKPSLDVKTDSRNVLGEIGVEPSSSTGIQRPVIVGA